MTDLLSKLNHRGQRVNLVNVPPEITGEIEALFGGTETTAELGEHVDFAVVFVRTLAEVERFGSSVLGRTRGDAIVWFCYPKGSSKRFTCEFNRDTGWSVLREHPFEPVRQVSLNEDWSALRFRHVDHIKSLTRRESFAITDAAKRRTTGRGR